MTATVEAGEEVELHSGPNGEPVTWVVHPFCGDERDGYFYCDACHVALATASTKGRHIRKRRRHQLVWVCRVHGPEEPQ